MAEPIWEGEGRIVKVTPPDYRHHHDLPGNAPATDLKASVTIHTEHFGELHFPVDRSRMIEFDEMAANKVSVHIRVG